MANHKPILTKDIKTLQERIHVFQSSLDNLSSQSPLYSSQALEITLNGIIAKHSRENEKLTIIKSTDAKFTVLAVMSVLLQILLIIVVLWKLQ